MSSKKVGILRRLFSWILARANSRKEKMLAIINDDAQWQAHCHKKKLTPKMQKLILSSYGIKKDPVIISQPITEIESNISIPNNDSAPLDSSNTLKTIWIGDTKDIEFTYESSRGEKLRRTVKPTEIYIDNGYIYLNGMCLTRNAPRTFLETNITTKIKVGSKRYDFDEWCEEILHIDLDSVWEDSHTDCA